LSRHEKHLSDQGGGTITFSAGSPFARSPPCRGHAEETGKRSRDQ
jgi:hypothetical protein